jgi:uncharacterized membrane protein
MSTKAIYLGDTDLKGSAGYLAGIMTHCGIDFEHLASNRRFQSALFGKGFDVLIISDYPSANFTGRQLADIRNRVEAGMGLLMIGGWESFTGKGGGYQSTCLKYVLPVWMSDTDDRRNFWGPCVVEKVCNHEIVDSLPFDESAPCVCGYNEIRAKDDASCVLCVQRFDVSMSSGGEPRFAAKEKHPLLVVGRYGEGNVACFASDVAPHWAGGFVDWGLTRIAVKAEGGNEIEVGDHYVRLFANMVKWAGGTNS